MNHVSPESIESAAWVGAISIALIAVLFCIYLFWMRRNRFFLPRGIAQWLATATLFFFTFFLSFIALLALRTRVILTAEVPYFEGVIGAVAPDLIFTSFHGDKAEHLEHYRDKPVMLNFWATWCAPCRTELPILEQLQRRYKERGLQILALTDEERGVVEQFLSYNEIDLQVGLFDSNPGMKTPFKEASVLRPFTFFIDRKGQIRDFVIGGGELEFFEEKILGILE